MSAIGLYVLLLVLGLLFFPAPTKVDLKESFLSPSWGHPFGKDRLGRDVFSMFAYGSVATFLFAVPARILTLALASAIGLVSYSNTIIKNNIISPLSSVFVSLPSLLLALLVVQVFGSGPIPLFLAIVLGDWAQSYETIRAKIEEVSGSGYVLAATCFGASRSYIFRKHLLPQTFRILGILLTTGLPSVVMTLAIFGFLGISSGSEIFGPGLGEQIAFSKDYAERAPWALVFPTLGILGLVFSVGGKS
ncbi:ABC transporter permease subunit [Leptospira wolffii]|uniref:ABC transporter permease n=1 Tax=Leptospira wolffii TaxID=409998 RepID=A0A2M9ZGC9_9LEPT|nr:ABC transporter permease subunit [Leptospira wolffii]PJZ67407.1 ABC transporter permease [Leptospira wolffii]TGK62892.1 ABC transporter permease subunit [Leptospira wolffii]TGK70699.1 ABC transporter permease subunit [Leptospira wolffii]TGK74862.1 ABC transporter permease subunit [Leptospira wolffii]TGL32281.1 ABC transporter permease subunit [Leptospira wolffii]